MRKDRAVFWIEGLVWLGLFFFCWESSAWAKSSSSEDSAKLYVIQLSSFVKKSNADEFVNLVKTKGYTPFVKIEGKETTWYKVRVGPYPSRQEAGEVARILRENHQWPAIILRISSEKRVRKVKVKPMPSADTSSLSSDTLADSGDSVDIIMSLFLIWLKAWQEKNTDSYFSLYSPDLEDIRKSFNGWKASRRKTFQRSGRIVITVSDVRIKKLARQIEMSFVQEYESDVLSDVGRKFLTWRLEGNQWRIVREQWKPIS